MNKDTKSKLFAFIDQIEILAQGVVHLTGTADAGKLIESAEDLKAALNNDETL